MLVTTPPRDARTSSPPARDDFNRSRPLSTALMATFEGELRFVPGSLREPAGAMFAVRVAPFPLARRDDEFVF